ncbi:phosphoribosyltransferase (plasmid) [Haloferax mediterranei ATCC 33500]|uniref:Phosphoribosyltransferase n=1 Tax=Haloferax mediterranei (strain ATCC 33500 / DSM 1411 / JCM 8866 / NBRC 14739 / NCIMB 2177 / R-4) TaxID=523841 RepID=I3RA00_HALMT|nr:phosphoribosyltransferase family protein [Haloferax mediterranei]AFK21060.1 phosphoribosyltransferase [Haloferax mediterranei ATCC 33500]AHZ24082.1 phosphoribosyltransferase [Haloferax mediterranei ATCC 33500]EMA05156.1 phosphoribosyltransferase [Haloferax mediterranei ATCC 33500]MDX5989769.1 phosphoribosyltransferase family protein [Haloferax mediterranei ATCC 33500]QCQ77216.1 phosphoribosyltransferase [Haloferax mediterranei ATCC 33500]
MGATSKFTDRTEAGQLLAEELNRRDIEADIVLAIPRGGLPLGRPVADALDVPLDIVVAKKIGAPGNPEYALGAVTSDGSVWRNEEGLRGFGDNEEYFEQKRAEEAENARAKAERYREGDAPDLTDKTVVIVDDGVATGSTIKACIQPVRTAADRVIVAVPVGPPHTIDEVRQMVDEVVCLQTPSSFMGVGQFYRNFEQVTDEEAMTYLEQES